MFFLIVTAWACLATSIAQDNVDEGDFYIVSDCASPTSEGTISVSAGQITAPGGTSYTDFGFPQSTVTLGTANTGVVGGANRSCIDTYSNQNQSYIFTCSDNGQYACSILLIEQ
ncbi:MAG: hypothetical protein AB7N80_10980 [Bdellovibrionales bacterium]